MPNRNYDMLAVDLDGTLFGPDGTVSNTSRDAVDRARADGLEIVICTGRAYHETMYAIEAIDAHAPAAGQRVAPIISAGGAAVVDVVTEQLMHVWRLQPELVERLCARFEALGRAPLILKHRAETGYDYCVIDYGPLEFASSWWFTNMDLEVRTVSSYDADEHPECSLRVGFAATADVMRELVTPLQAEFGGETFMQHFAAVAGSHKASPNGSKDETVQLLEVFHPEVNKWKAIHTLASAQGIPDERVAAIGDEINDLSMIEHAGLGIAMGNAVPRIKEVANRETACHSEEGLARAIDRILDGSW